MNQPLAEALTHLRMGNQSFLVAFYEEQRDHFARWVRRQHQLEPAAAHELLRTVLVDFYDQVIDGRVTKLPADLRNYLYGMAQEQIQAQKTTTELPKTEASRRQQLLRVFTQLGTDSQQVLMYFYFRGYNFEKVAGKMGFANATVAKLQKSGSLRKLLELRTRVLGAGPTGGPAPASAT